MTRFALTFLFLLPAFSQQIYLQPAERINMPGTVDSNSPAFWLDGTLYVHNSEAMPVRSQGPNQAQLGRTRAVVFDTYFRVFRWIEATWVAPNGWVYAWYHHEPGLVCGNLPLTAPQIGALVSFNGGAGYFDLGIVLDSGDPLNCDTSNGYFAGGHGDFSVIADEEGQYLYFFFGNYSGPPDQQGVAVARMAIEDRDEPLGKVQKYFEGAWEEPGLYGRVTPVFPARAPWEVPETDSFWGPSLHYNTHLGKFVMLLNHACCHPGWPQEGIYAATSSDLASPESWSQPVKIHDIGNWYPQVLGFEPGGTDKRAGAIARFYMGGESDYVIRFDGSNLQGFDQSKRPAIPMGPRPLPNSRRNRYAPLLY